MGVYLLLSLLLITGLGWRSTRRKLSKHRQEIGRENSREMDEVLPEVAQGAWLTMYSTFFSISMYPPFLNKSGNGSWDETWTQLGIEYREALTEAQVKWFEKHQNTDLSPLEYAVGALTSFDEVLKKYRSEIDLAHSRMMKRYEGQTMPLRDQQGFNWVKIW